MGTFQKFRPVVTGLPAPGRGSPADPHPLCFRVGAGGPQDVVSLRGSQGAALPTAVWPPYRRDLESLPWILGIQPAVTGSRGPGVTGGHYSMLNTWEGPLGQSHQAPKRLRRPPGSGASAVTPIQCLWTKNKVKYFGCG